MQHFLLSTAVNPRHRLRLTMQHFLLSTAVNPRHRLRLNNAALPSLDSCKFVHAVCMYDGLTAAHTGQCTSTAVPPSTVSSGNAAGSSAAATTVGPGSSASTAPPTTTLSPETIAFQNVFCRNKDSINCPTVVTPLCGSDGVVYDSR